MFKTLILICLIGPKILLASSPWSQDNDNLNKAWKIEKGKKSIKVAVIDTGIDFNHPQLKDNIFPGGWDFVSNMATPRDYHGHGTHVSGIIKNIADVSLLPIRYYSEYNSGQTNLTNTIKSILYSKKENVRIVNYSGGGETFSIEERNAIKNSPNILFVVAAGNESTNLDKLPNYFPASYKLSNMIIVTSVNTKNRLARRVNWGPQTVDVGAPGKNIYSTLPNNRYGYMSGTSQATAFVSGVVALILSNKPNLTPKQVRDIILKSSNNLSHLEKFIRSGNRINAHRALLMTERDYDENEASQ